MCWVPLCEIISAWRIRVLTRDGVKQLLELCFANGTFQQPSNVCVKTCNAMLEWCSVEHATHQLWRFVLSKLRLHFLAFCPKMSTAELRCEHTPTFWCVQLQPDVLHFFLATFQSRYNFCESRCLNFVPVTIFKYTIRMVDPQLPF